MAKVNIWQWDETPANNTEIDGIDITGATGKVKDGDNAFREMMSQIITAEGKGSDVASAATLTLGTERYYHVTGTTTITDIDFTDSVNGRWAWLIFDGALTLTHNGTTLKLPGGANITTAAGDRALFVQDSSDNVICLDYVPAAEAPYSEGTWTPAVSFGGGTTGITYGLQSGRWTKNGRAVTIEGRVTLTAKGSSTGGALITGLPFATSIAGFTLIGLTGFTGLTAGLVGNGSGSSIVVRAPNTTGAGQTTDANFSNTSDIVIGGSYSV